MIGIKNVGVYIPDKRINNLNKASIYGVDTGFIKKKIGIAMVSRKKNSEMPSDLCVSAFKSLYDQEETDLNIGNIDFLCVCTQNGDFQLPHTSAIVHSKLGLNNRCAVFDISLGCSGYPYSLLIAKNFMEANLLKNGLVFTSDPYSRIIDESDKNTALIFGDAATVTHLTEKPIIEIQKGTFFSDGDNYHYLIKRENEKLEMNGRGIFGFVMKNVPDSVNECLNLNRLEKSDIDLFIFHQASRYVIDNLVNRLQLDKNKVPFNIEDIGNTVSSAIPILLNDILKKKRIKNIIITGFGVGLSIASLYVRRIHHENNK
jgi:3-oxoacyl-[acyl-carrier-protein] synthase-3